MDTNNRVHIRWYIRRDLDDYINIEKECFKYPWLVNDFLRVFDNRKVSAFTAEYREKVIGYLVFEIRKKYLSIINLAIHPDFQRQGVATELIKNLKTRLSEGRTKMKAEVADYNLDAHLFFKSQEFKAIKIVPQFFDGTDAYKFVYNCKSLQLV